MRLQKYMLLWFPSKSLKVKAWGKIYFSPLGQCVLCFFTDLYQKVKDVGLQLQLWSNMTGGILCLNGPSVVSIKHSLENWHIHCRLHLLVFSAIFSSLSLSPWYTSLGPLHGWVCRPHGPPVSCNCSSHPSGGASGSPPSGAAGAGKERRRMTKGKI